MPVHPSRILIATTLSLSSFLAPSLPTCAAQDIAAVQVFQEGLGRACYLGSPPGEPERILIAQLDGVIRVVENGVLLPTPFLDIRARANASHGLVGFAFPPDYATSRRFYVNYVNSSSQFGTQPVIARYTTSANPNIANTAEEVLLRTTNGSGDHVAGWIDFGPDGYLYIARGDIGGAPQNPQHLPGKILRLDVSTATGYAIPPDNPYVGVPGLDEIAAIGVRNPYRNSFDSLTGDLYLADVGAGRREEINFIPSGTIAGRNFGWPCYEGTVCTGCGGCQINHSPPIYEYGHPPGVCVIGGFVYRGSALPRWRGRYLFADCASIFRSFRVVNGQAVDVQNHWVDFREHMPIGSTIAFGEDAHGELYILDHVGRILKIIPEFATADWDLDGAVNSADFFAFLADFFELNADVTGDHLTTSADFFEYLSELFGG